MSNSRSTLAGLVAIAAFGALSSAPIAARHDATTARNTVTTNQAGQQQKAQAPKGAAAGSTSAAATSRTAKHGALATAGPTATSSGLQRKPATSSTTAQPAEAE